jgi:hypothetical protein
LYPHFKLKYSWRVEKEVCHGNVIIICIIILVIVVQGRENNVAIISKPLKLNRNILFTVTQPRVFKQLDRNILFTFTQLYLPPFIGFFKSLSYITRHDSVGVYIVFLDLLSPDGWHCYLVQIQCTQR